MKKFLWKIFVWRIEVNISKISTTLRDDRCLYLANRLYKEVESYHEIKSTDDVSGFNVWYIPNSKSKSNFRIINILAGWEIKGDKI